MYKHLLNVFICLGLPIQLFIACHKVEEIVPFPEENPPVIVVPPVVQPCNITKLKYEGGYDYSFMYDSKNRLIGSELLYPKIQGRNAKSIFVVEYDNNDRAVKLIESQYDTLNRKLFTLITNIEYNGTGKLTSFYYNSDTSSRRTLSFDTKGKLLRIDEPVNIGGYTRFEYDEKGNRTGTYINTAFNPEYVTLFTKYDDKKNPFLDLGIVVYFMGFDPFSTNNFETIGSYDSNNNFISANYTFTYDEKEYPLTIVHSTQSGGSSKGVYFYQCDKIIY